MKILHIINSLATGGAEKLLLETIPLYQKRGIKVDLFVLNDNDTPFLGELRKLNCCTIYTAGKRSVYHPLNIFKIIPILKKYDIAHVHLFPAQYWVVCAKILSLSKVKLLFTEHNTSNRRLANSFFRIVDKRVYRFYNRIVCITNEIQTILLAHTSLPKSRFTVIENGVNLSKIEQAQPLLWSEIDKRILPNDTILIQVAGFREQKDQMTLIKALVHLPASIKLVLVGEGILKNDCESIVKELELQNRVFFIGLRMDVPHLLKSADIVVLSSYYEGLSLSSIEGMAAGKPFVASNVPGLKEVVQGAGILFPVGNEVHLAVEISKLLEDKVHYIKVAQACKDRAGEYDIHKMVDKHIKLYESVC